MVKESISMNKCIFHHGNGKDKVDFLIPHPPLKNGFLVINDSIAVSPKPSFLTTFCKTCYEKLPDMILRGVEEFVNVKEEF